MRLHCANAHAMLQGKGEGMHLDVSGICTAAELLRAPAPSHADELRRLRMRSEWIKSPPLRPPTLHASPGLALAHPPRFPGFVRGVGLFFTKQI